MSLCFKTVLRAGKINFLALKTFKNCCPDFRTVYYGLVLTWAGNRLGMGGAAIFSRSIHLQL